MLPYDGITRTLGLRCDTFDRGIHAATHWADLMAAS